jgi:YopX protein
MRQIKFRVWNPHIHKMILPGEERFLHIELDGRLNWWTGKDGMPLDGGKLILMQWTGLLDKNGKEIFEGDIIDVAPHMRDSDFVRSLDKNPYLHEVKYEGFVICPFDYENNDEPDKYEVIGNIFEHPELLKGR